MTACACLVLVVLVLLLGGGGVAAGPAATVLRVFRELLAARPARPGERPVGRSLR